MTIWIKKSVESHWQILQSGGRSDAILHLGGHGTGQHQDRAQLLLGTVRLQRMELPQLCHRGASGMRCCFSVCSNYCSYLTAHLIMQHMFNLENGCDPMKLINRIPSKICPELSPSAAFWSPSSTSWPTSPSTPRSQCRRSSAPRQSQW